MAGIRASSRGRNTIIIDKNPVPGRKLLISGKGRCNVTNAEQDVTELLKNFSKTGQFLRNALYLFSNKDLMDFFAAQSVELIVERGKRVFPGSGRSADILNALTGAFKKNGGRIMLNRDIQEVKKTGGAFECRDSRGGSYFSSGLLLATGGLSYPETGSTGFGYKAARALGHEVIEPRPALVGINVPEIPSEWQGISLKNVSCSVNCNGRTGASGFGEMMFTHFGLSGPVILDLSAGIYDLLSEKKEVFVDIDLKPALDNDKLDDRLVREFQGSPNKDAQNVLKTLLPKNMIDGFLKITGIKADKKVHQMTRQDRALLASHLKRLRFRVSRVRPISEAIVTRGGVSTREINPKTMESKIVPGLYFAGELIDVDARTGGYNLQCAFSTGFVAGENI